jgi:hypothetical protein
LLARATEAADSLPRRRGPLGPVLILGDGITADNSFWAIVDWAGAEGLQFLSKFMKPGMRYALEGLDRYLPGAKAHGETASNFVKTVDDFIRKFDVDLTKGAAETMDADISLGLRTTGRAEPLTLNEKMAYQAVIADPLNSNATVLRIQLNDPRWPASQGWVKMAQNIRGIEIHYNYNTITGAIDDIKFIFIDL